jgi:hypothetical protein
MSSLVLDLQKETMDSDSETSKLLLKAYAVANKLKIDEFEKWAELELDGYHGEEIPPYRNVRGELKYWDPFQGYKDFLIDHEGLYDIFSTRNLNNSIAELEDLHKQGGTDPVIFPIPPEIQISFLKRFNTDVGPQYLFVATPRIKAILDAVRKIVLDWALKLEEDGILGEDSKFTIREKKIAEEKSSKYNTMIKDSVVQIGEGNVQNVNQINLEEVSDLLKNIKESLDDLQLDEDNEKELNAGIDTIDSQMSLQQPNQVIIKESLKSIRNVLEGCAGSAITPVLVGAVTKLIGF